jgi:protein-tyrosine phosphatase
MAAELLRHVAGREGLTDLLVDSAGTLGIEGAPASPEAVEALREIGLDLSRHRSRGVDTGDLETADLVLAMADGHLSLLRRLSPVARGERFLLRAFEHGASPASGVPAVPDPIGQPIEFYREQLVLLERCVRHVVLYLKDPNTAREAR